MYHAIKYLFCQEADATAAKPAVVHARQPAAADDECPEPSPAKRPRMSGEAAAVKQSGSLSGALGADADVKIPEFVLPPTTLPIREAVFAGFAVAYLGARSGAKDWVARIQTANYRKDAATKHQAIRRKVFSLEDIPSDWRFDQPVDDSKAPVTPGYSVLCSVLSELGPLAIDVIHQYAPSGELPRPPAAACAFALHLTECRRASEPNVRTWCHRELVLGFVPVEVIYRDVLGDVDTLTVVLAAHYDERARAIFRGNGNGDWQVAAWYRMAVPMIRLYRSDCPHHTCGTYVCPGCFSVQVIRSATGCFPTAIHPVTNPHPLAARPRYPDFWHFPWCSNKPGLNAVADVHLMDDDARMAPWFRVPPSQEVLRVRAVMKQAEDEVFCGADKSGFARARRAEIRGLRL